MRGLDLVAKWRRSLREENIEHLENYIALYPELVHTIFNQYISSLFEAILENKNKSVYFLLEHGAEMNWQNHRGVSPLMLAIMRRNEEVIYTLIDRGADLTLMDENGFTALFCAIQSTLPEVCTRLIDAGVTRISSHFSLTRDLLYRIPTYMLDLLCLEMENFDEDSARALKAARLSRLLS
jgi:ankyrin repeat protein